MFLQGALFNSGGDRKAEAVGVNANHYPEDDTTRTTGISTSCENSMLI